MGWKMKQKRIALKKSMLYTLTVSLVTLAYFLSVYVVERVLCLFLQYDSYPVTLAAIIFLSIACLPIKIRIQRNIDKCFFNGSICEIEEQRDRLLDELHYALKHKQAVTFASGIAHEIKNPLTSIKTFTEYVDKKYHDARFRRKFRFLVGRELERINRTVDQLMDFSRPVKLEKTRIDVNALLKETVEFVKYQAKKNDVRIKRHFEDIPCIYADGIQIQQVFLNIILNAFDAITKNGRVTISTGMLDNRKVFVSIKDTGKGLSSGGVKKIFEPFYTTKTKGSGLGLWIVVLILKRHNASIGVKSKLGSGTEFVIKFPVK